MALPSLTPVRGAGRRPWTRPGPGSGAGTAGGAPGDPRPWLPAVVLALVVAAVTAGALLLVLGPMSGTDGSAQVARADFWAAHPWSPLDLRWYGGVSSWGYSLLTPPLVAGLGTRGAGAVCAVVAAGALAVLLVRAEVRRPRLGAAVGAVALCGNLPPGRNAFALGTALGLLALVAAGSAGSGGRRRAAAVLLAVATPLASPVAGLFLALAGTALALTGRRRAGLVTLLAAGLPLLALQLLYGDGGQMPFAWLVAWPPVVAALAVAALAQPPARVLRTGALLYAAGVLLTYLVPMALGSNVERLALLLTAPLLAATAGVPPALQLRREGRGRRAVRSPQPTGAGGVGEAGQSTGSRGGSVEARGAALPWGSRRVSVGARGAAPPLASRVASVCARAAALPLGSLQ